MTAEPELPGVIEYADGLETAHRAATWPGIDPPDPNAPTTADPDPNADLRDRIVAILSRRPGHHPSE